MERDLGDPAAPLPHYTLLGSSPQLSVGPGLRHKATGSG
jgi:hypothetical protein